MGLNDFDPVSGPWELWVSDTPGQVDLTWAVGDFTNLGEFDLKFDHDEAPYAEDRAGHTRGRSRLTQVNQGMDQALEGVMLECNGINDSARAVFYGEDQLGVLEQGEMPRPGHQSHRIFRTMFAINTADPTYSRVYPKTTMDGNFQRRVAHMAATLAYPIRRILLPYRTPATGTGDEATSADLRDWFYRVIDLSSSYDF